jgi:hypothetical protein
VGGDDQPVVRCRECNAKSCFTHRIPWHEGLTCAQYNSLIAEGRGRSELDKQGQIITWKARLTRLVPIPSLPSFSSGAVSSLSRSIFSKSTPNLNADASKTQAEAESRRLRHAAAQEKKIRDDTIKKQRQEAASLRTIRHHCKICPGEGCNWPIQKNDGCAHMTCECFLFLFS